MDFDFDSMRAAIKNANTRGTDSFGANKLTQNYLDNQASIASKYNQQQQGQQEDLSGYRKADGIEGFMAALQNAGESLSDLTGFSEKWQKNFHDDQGNFTLDKANVGNTLDTAFSFITGLPGQMVGGLIEAPAQFFEAGTGVNMMNTKNVNGQTYVSNESLDNEQRIASAANAVINVGLAPTGLGRAAYAPIKAIASTAAKDAGKQTLAKAALKEAAKGAAEEAPQEFVQGYLDIIRGDNGSDQHGFAAVAADPNKAFSQALEGAALGALGGGIMGGAGGGLSYAIKNDSNGKVNSDDNLVGDSSPFTPLQSLKYGENARTASGNILQSAATDIRKETEENQQVAATTAKLIDNPALGWSQIEIGLDQLRASYNSRDKQGRTGSDVISNLLGYNDWARETGAAYQTLDQLLMRENEGDYHAMKVADNQKISVLNEYLKYAADSGQVISAVVGKNPHNRYGLVRTQIAGVRNGGATWVHGALAKALNSDHDGDTVQLYLDDTDPMVKSVDWGHTKLVSNLIEGDDRSGLNDMLQFAKGEGEAVDNASTLIYTTLYGILGESKAKKYSDMWARFAKFSAMSKSDRKNIIARLNGDKKASVDNMVLQDGDAYQVGQFIDKVLQEATDLTSDQKRVLVDTLVQNVQSAGLDVTIPGAFDSSTSAAIDHANEAATTMLDLGQRGATLGAYVEVLADTILQMGNHLSFGKLDSPAFFRQLQQMYQKNKGELLNAEGTGFEATDAVKMWTASFYHIFKLNKAPMDLMKDYMNTIVDVEVRGVAGDTLISTEESYESVKKAFIEKYNSVQTMMQSVYEEAGPLGDEVPFSDVMPSKIESDQDFYDAWNRVYGEAFIEKQYGDQGWLNGLTTSEVISYLSYDTDAAGSLFGSDKFLREHFKQLAKAQQRADARIENGIKKDIEKTYVNLVNSVQGRIVDGVIDDADIPFVSALMNYMYKIMPKLVGVRQGFADPDTIFSKNATQWAKALVSNDPEQVINGIFSTMIRDTYRGVIEIAQQMEREGITEAEKRVLESKAMLEINKIQYTPLHKVIGSMINLKTDENSVSSIAGIAILKELADTSIPYSQKEATIKAMGTGTAWNMDDPPILKWVLENSDSKVAESGMTTRYSEAKTFLNRANKLDRVSLISEVETIDDSYGALSGQDIVQVLRNRKNEAAGRMSTDILASLVQESSFVGKGSADKGTSEPYATALWAMAQISAHGSTMSTVDQVSGMSFGKMKLSDLQQNPIVLAELVLDNKMSIIAVDDNTGQECIVNQETLFEGIEGYSKDKPLEWSTLSSFLKANPQFVTVLSDLDLQVSPVGETRVAWKQSRTLSQAVADGLKKGTDEVAFQETVMKNKLFSGIINKPNGLVTIAAMLDLSGSNISNHANLVNQIEDAKNNLYDLFRYVAQGATQTERNNRAKEIMNDLSVRQMDLLRTSRNFSAIFKDFNADPISQALQQQMSAAMVSDINRSTLENLNEALESIESSLDAIDGIEGEDASKETLIASANESLNKNVTSMVNDLIAQCNDYRLGMMLALKETFGEFEYESETIVPADIMNGLNSIQAKVEELTERAQSKSEGISSFIMEQVDKINDTVASIKGYNPYNFKAWKKNKDGSRTFVDAPMDMSVSVLDGFPVLLERDEISSFTDPTKRARYIHSQIEEIQKAYQWNENIETVEELSNMDSQKLEALIQYWNKKVFTRFYSSAVMQNPVNSTDANYLDTTVDAINDLYDMLSSDELGSPMRDLTDSLALGRGEKSKQITKPVFNFNLMDARNAWSAQKMYSTGATGNVSIGVSEDNQMTRYLVGFSFLPRNIICDNNDFQAVNATDANLLGMDDGFHWYLDPVSGESKPLNRQGIRAIMESGADQVMVLDSREHKCTCAGCKHASRNPIGNSTGGYNALVNMVRLMLDACEPMHLKAKSHLDRAEDLTKQVTVDPEIVEKSKFPNLVGPVSPQELIAAMESYRNDVRAVFEKTFDDSKFSDSFSFGAHEAAVMANALNQVIEVKYTDGTYGKVTMDQLMKAAADENAAAMLFEEGKVPESYRAISMTLQQMSTIITNHVIKEFNAHDQQASNKDFEEWAMTAIREYPDWNPHGLNISKVIDGVAPIGRFYESNRSFDWTPAAANRFAQMLHANGQLHEAKIMLSRSEDISTEEARFRKSELDKVFKKSNPFGEASMLGNVFGYSESMGRLGRNDYRSIVKPYSGGTKNLYDPNELTVNFCLDPKSAEAAQKYMRKMPRNNVMLVPQGMTNDFNTTGFNKMQIGYTPTINNVPFDVYVCNPIDFSSAVTSETGKAAWTTENFRKNIAVFLVDDTIDAPGDGSIHLINDDGWWSDKTYSRTGQTPFRISDDHDFLSGTTKTHIADKQEIVSDFSDIDSVTGKDLEAYLEEMNVSLKDYEKASDGNIPSSEVARQVKAYIAYAKSSDSSSSVRTGMVTRNQCVGLLRTQDSKGNIAYTPILTHGSMPVSMNVTNVAYDSRGRCMVDWKSEIPVVSNEGGSKMYTYPSYKGYAHVVSNVATPAISTTAGTASLKVNGLLSEEAFSSRAQDIEGDFVRRNLHYLWKLSGGSIFGKLGRDAEGNEVFEWNPAIKRGNFWDAANDAPSTDLIQMLNGDIEAWNKFLSPDSTMNLLGSSGDESNYGETLHYKKVNEAMRSLGNFAKAKGASNIMYMFSTNELSFDENTRQLVKGQEYNIDWDPLIFLNTMSDNHVLAFFNEINEDFCPENQAASSDGKIIDQFGRVEATHNGQTKRMTCMLMKPRFGDESGEFTVASAGAKMSMQHMIKQSFEHGVSADVLQSIMGYQGLFNGSPENAVSDYLSSDNEMIQRRIANMDGTSDTMIETYHAGLPVLSPSYTASQTRDALSVMEIGRSYLDDNRPIIDSDGNPIKNWETEGDIFNACELFNRALGIVDGKKKFTPYQIVNQFYKMYITYTKNNTSEINFYESDVVAGIQAMTESIENRGLVIPGGLTVPSLNKKIGDRYSMPLLPDEWSRTLFDNSKKIRDTFNGDYNAFKTAMADEYENETREAVANIKDDGKRRAILMQHAWVESKTGLDLNLGRVIGNTFMADIVKSDNLLLKVVSGYPGVNGENLKSVLEQRKQHVKDAKKVGEARNHWSNDGNRATATKVSVNQATMIKALRQVSSWNKFMALMNPFIAAGNLTERAVYQNMMNGVLFFSDKFGIGPFKNSDKYTINNQFDVVKQASHQDKMVQLYSAFRMLDLNGDFNIGMFGNELRNSEDIYRYIEDRTRELGMVERVQQNVMNVVSGKDVMLAKQIQNFWNRFIQIASQRAEAGDPVCQRLFQESIPGSGSFISERLNSDDPASFLAEVMSPMSEYNDIALLASNWAKRGDMAQRSAIGMVWSEIAANHPVFEFMATTNVCRFVQYSTNMTERVLNFVAPMSTIRYLYTDILSKSERMVPGLNGISFKDLHLEDAQMHQSVKEALMVDAAHMSAGALAATLVALSGAIEPPDDEDKWGNTDEWLIFGLRVHENWWLSDLLGPALAMACAAKSAMLGKPRMDIISNKLGECLYNNPALKVGSLVTELMDPYSSAMDAYYADHEKYESTKQSNATAFEVFTSDAAVYGMNWLASFLTPSIAKEIYQDAQQYETSYKKVYKTDKRGNVIYNDDGTPQIDDALYLDSKIRKLTQKNPVWALIMNTITGAEQNGTGYFANEMPRTVYYDPEQMASVKNFSLMNDDGTPKSD